MSALADLPFPEELATGKSSKPSKGSKQPTRTGGLSIGSIGAGLGALETILGGGDPVQDIINAEIDSRVSNLKQRYTKWWDKHFSEVEKASPSFWH